MFGTLGAPELLLILAIVVLLFGVGKVGRLGKDLGVAVKEFRHAIKDEDRSDSAPSLATDVDAIRQSSTVSASPAKASLDVDSVREPAPEVSGPKIF